MIKSTDFAPLPESEWTEEELANGFRVVCKRNDDDPRRLDAFVEFRDSITLVSFDWFPTEESP